MNFQNRFCIPLIFCGFLLFVSCSDDNPASVTPEPPPLPPVSSMKMDISLFQPFDVTAKENTAADSSHFHEALSRVGFLILTIETKLFLPRRLLELADKTKSKFKNGKWVWEYSAEMRKGTFSTRLVAEKENGKIHWSFYISISNRFLDIENALLFEGITNKEGTRGKWTYYNLVSLNGESPKPMSRLEWVIKSENNIRLTLTILTDLGIFGGNAGDAIKYTFDGTVKKLTIHRVKTGITTVIAWNVNTKAGYILAPNYNNGKKACWDSQLQNVACSEVEI